MGQLDTVNRGRGGASRGFWHMAMIVFKGLQVAPSAKWPLLLAAGTSVALEGVLPCSKQAYSALFVVLTVLHASL